MEPKLYAVIRGVTSAGTYVNAEAPTTASAHSPIKVLMLINRLTPCRDTQSVTIKEAGMAAINTRPCL